MVFIILPALEKKNVKYFEPRVYTGLCLHAQLNSHRFIDIHSADFDSAFPKFKNSQIEIFDLFKVFHWIIINNKTFCKFMLSENTKRVYIIFWL